MSAVVADIPIMSELHHRNAFSNLNFKMHAVSVLEARLEEPELHFAQVHLNMSQNMSNSASITPSNTQETVSGERSRTVVPVSICRFEHDEKRVLDDAVVLEEPLEIRLQQGDQEPRSLTVTMRTPGHDAELAAGFLLTEGVLDDAADIISLQVSSSQLAHVEASVLPDSAGMNLVTVTLADDARIRTASLERNFYTTSSCGICGKASLLALRSVCPPRRENNLSLDFEMLTALPKIFHEAQATFQQTGGLHAAALFSPDGTMQLLREDVGRHNAVDKLVGKRFLEDAVPLRDTVLMLSGRVSFELMQKAVMAGIPAVAAVGAPSSLAIAVAREFQITLVGFLREGRCNVYHGAEHITRHLPTHEFRL